MESIKEKDFKYYCEKCNFGCNVNSRWERHVNTELHIIGKKKIRSDFKGENICEHCDFQTKNIQQFKEHTLNYHSNKEKREKEFKYYCKLCNFGTFTQNLLDTHNNTKKHIFNEKIYNKE